MIKFNVFVKPNNQPPKSLSNCREGEGVSKERKMRSNKFCRHSEKRGISLYWILFAYLILGYFFPLVGAVALICMIGPILTALRKGSFWCDHICPRGNLFDRLLSKYSPHRPIPKFVRSFGFRLFMVFFIFAMFGVLIYLTWGDWNGMAQVFWYMVLITTVVGVVLSFIYAPRTWCAFCPIGTISSWVAPHKGSQMKQ